MKKYSLFLTLLLVLSACSGGTAEQKNTNDANITEENHIQHNHLSGDLQELTAIDELPTFLQSQPEEIAAVYEIVFNYADDLQWIPCYCGCGESAGHRSSLNCFIAEINEDTILWDDHGTRCLVCLETALESAKRSYDGQAIEDIRKYIDEKYKEGYAEPTPTAMPA